jgi:D-alanine-D-alanine ligase
VKIGITYDLRTWYLERGFSMEETAEFDKEETIAAIENVLISSGFETERIGNIYQLVNKLAAGAKWDLVFNIAEGMYGDGRESAVPALLDQYKIPYVFSGPVIMGISLNKYFARLVVEASGVPVSPGIIVAHMEDIPKTSCLSFPLFVKPVAEGTGKGITARSIVHNFEELGAICGDLLEKYSQPVLVEEYLPGREFTVGVVGSGRESTCIGGMEIICKDGLPYSNEVKENYKDYVEYIPIEKELWEECSKVSKDAWVALGGVDAGRIDLKADRNGKICFIEANPLAGLNPVHSDLPILSGMSNISYHELINKIIESAIKRGSNKI